MMRLSSSIVSFLRERRGVAAIEFAMIAPVLIFLLFGSATLFDGFRTTQIAEKATFTIGDIISRQTDVNKDFLDKMFATFNRMIRDNSGSTRFRVTSISRKDGKFQVDWSYAAAPQPGMTDGGIPAGILPDIANGDSVVVVETGVTKATLTNLLGFGEAVHNNTAVNRPRFVSAIAKTG